jgi:purine-nucleoside phosphorylase
MNEPLNGAVRIFNEISDLFEFGGTRDGFRVRINALGLELF